MGRRRRAARRAPRRYAARRQPSARVGAPCSAATCRMRDVDDAGVRTPDRLLARWRPGRRAAAWAPSPSPCRSPRDGRRLCLPPAPRRSLFERHARPRADFRPRWSASLVGEARRSWARSFDAIDGVRACRAEPRAVRPLARRRHRRAGRHGHDPPAPARPRAAREAHASRPWCRPAPRRRVEPEGPAGTGPYRIERFVPRPQRLLVRNPRFRPPGSGRPSGRLRRPHRGDHG